MYTYILGNTKLAIDLNLKNKDFRICVELPIKIHQKGYLFIDIPSYEKPCIGRKKSKRL